jgi:pimeloyl-ACP methyl ester carboxylesterase
MESIRSSRGSADYRAAKGILRDILVKVVNESYESQLGALDTPVTLIWGSDDREVPPAVAEAALAVIREAGGRAELQVLPDVGHFVPTEAPAALGQAVARALES